MAEAVRPKGESAQAHNKLQASGEGLVVWDLAAATLAFGCLAVALLKPERRFSVIAIIPFLISLQEFARPIRVFTSLLVVGLFAAELYKRLIRKLPLDLWVPAFVLPFAVLLSLLIQPTIDHPYSRLDASGIVLSYVGAFAVFQLLWWTLPDADSALRILRRLTLFIAACAGVGVLIASMGLTEAIADLQAAIQAEAGLPVFSDRQFLFFRHPNQNAYFTGFGLFFLVARFLSRERKKSRTLGFDTPELAAEHSATQVSLKWKENRRRRNAAIFLGAAFTACALNFILTGSRGALVAMPIAFLIGFFLAGRFRLFVTTTFAATVAIPIVFLLLVGINTGEAATTEGEEIGSRLQSLTDPSTALETRPILWKAAFSAFMEKPIFGVGPTNLPYYFLYETPEMITWSEEFLSTAPAHSLYLHLLATTGVVGLMGFLYFMIVLARRFIRGAKNGPTPASRELSLSGLFTLLFLAIVGLLGHTVLGIYYFNTAIFFAIFSLALIGTTRPHVDAGHEAI